VSDRHVQRTDVCHLCHTYVSPFHRVFLLGVTPVSLVSCTETRVSIGAENRVVQTTKDRSLNYLLGRVAGDERADCGGHQTIVRLQLDDCKRAIKDGTKTIALNELEDAIRQLKLLAKRLEA
jgi:hypothetical protein